MLKKLGALLFLSLLIITLAGCRNPQFYEKSFTSADFEQEQNQTWYVPGVRGQDRLEVTLFANPSTGYVWRIAVTDEQGTLVKDGSPLYQPPAEGLMGAAGTELWKFKISGRGPGYVSMEYVREFEAGKEPLWTLDIVVE